MRVRWRWMWVGATCFAAMLAAGSCQLFVDGDITLASDASVPLDGLVSNESSDDGGEGDTSSAKDGSVPPPDGPATDAGSTFDAAHDAIDDTAESSPACGAQGQICCADASCDQAMGVGESTCSHGMCIPCGTQGQTCCVGSTCANDFMCAGGVCAACGTQGLPCCTGSTCNTGLACTSETCVACGAGAEPCCPGSKCNTSGLVCVDAGCAACGDFQQPCCAGDTCNAPNVCMGGKTCTTN